MQNCLVTGGVNGIGRAIVQKLLDRGDNLFVFDLVDMQDARVKELTSLGVKYFFVDIANQESLNEAFSKLYSYLDDNKLTLDVLVNNAGIARDGLALRMSKTDWDSVININLTGAFLCCQNALKRMFKQNKSYIINISSIVGLTGNFGQANYAASKAGLISLTKTLAQEYGSRNVLVNAIAPGFIQTALTDRLSENIKSNILNRISLKRFGTPKDVANLVDFLTSGNADYITGSVINLDGGMF